MLRFLVWMIIVFVAAKILGQVIRYVRLLFTPNKNVLHHRSSPSKPQSQNIEDIPYEEMKDKP